MIFVDEYQKFQEELQEARKKGKRDELLYLANQWTKSGLEALSNTQLELLLRMFESGSTILEKDDVISMFESWDFPRDIAVAINFVLEHEGCSIVNC